LEKSADPAVGLRGRIALGREEGHGGSDGQGIGGGVYNLGIFTDFLSVIKNNHASTSNNDIFP
jgi:hypothetical protein